MKRMQRYLIGYCLAMGLIGASTLIVTSCSAASTSTLDLSSIKVTTLPPSGFYVGAILQFTAIGTYLGGSTADITSQVTWTSSDPKIVTISSTGLATGLAVGTADITANLSGLTSMPVTLPVLFLVVP